MFGLITGSGFYEPPDLLQSERHVIDSPYGAVPVTTGSWKDQAVAFVARHGSDHSIPPHRINYRGNIWALHHMGAEVICATAVSGAVNPALRPGQLVLISDYLNLTSGRADTFFDGSEQSGLSPQSGSVVHADMTTPYDPATRDLIRHAAVTESIDLVDGGVYCTANGPRFETPAEIRMMATMGADLVGMTGYPEVALAVEAGVPYASIGVVSNMAAGMADEKLTIDDVMKVIEGVAEPLYRLLQRTVESFNARHTDARPTGNAGPTG